MTKHDKLREPYRGIVDAEEWRGLERKRKRDELRDLIGPTIIMLAAMLFMWLAFQAGVFAQSGGKDHIRGASAPRKMLPPEPPPPPPPPPILPPGIIGPGPYLIWWIPV